MGLAWPGIDWPRVCGECAPDACPFACQSHHRLGNVTHVQHVLVLCATSSSKPGLVACKSPPPAAFALAKQAAGNTLWASEPPPYTPEWRQVPRRASHPSALALLARGGGVEVWLKHEDGWAARRRKTFKHSTPLPCTQQNLWYAPSAQSIFRFGSVARDQRTATICGPTRKRVAQVEAPMHQTTGHTPKASIIGPSDAPTRHIAGGQKQGWEWRR